MSAHAVTLHLPAPIYERFKRRAKRQHKTVETELLDAVTTLADDELPGDLSAELGRLRELEDRALWHVARDHLSEEMASRLEALNHKKQRDGLTPIEVETQGELLRAWDRMMLLRAEAAALLKTRGHDVSELLAPV